MDWSQVKEGILAIHFGNCTGKFKHDEVFAALDPDCSLARPLVGLLSFYHSPSDIG
ncbi:hypothetical protein R5O87_04010 [Arthrobacter globiformis]|uniref:hypothetical protein n=1 Tax=Arthrobacter globiformis TaxID=1665 RepID=UPI00397B6345